jgi:CBS domain containing-hemolysin-like protein
MEMGSALILVGLFIAMEAFFSGCEIGLISMNRIKVQQKAADGITSAQQIEHLINNPDRLFAVTSLGTNLAVVSSTAIFTGYMVSNFGEMGDVFAFLLISPIILFAGEIVPKIIFQSRADSIMPVMVSPLSLFYKILSPVIDFFAYIQKTIFKGVTENNKETGELVSRDHIFQIIKLDSQTSDLDLTEKKLIHSIFKFGGITADQCMVPLVHLNALPDTATMSDAIAMANETGLSRLPIYHQRMFNLIGIINTFDLLTVDDNDTPITELIRPAYYIPPNKKIDDLLNELQQRGLHMAIIVDEYGGCVGIVTMEDCLEQIVGEIEDEYDEPEKKYEEYADGGYLIEGDMEIDPLNEQLDLNLPKGDYESVAGLIINSLEKIPAPGDQVVVGGYRLTVKEASKIKINTVILRKHVEETVEEDDELNQTNEL